MGPLSVEELKALPADEWVWIISKGNNFGEYVQKVKSDYDDVFEYKNGKSGTFVWAFENYGHTWIAYKNKESRCPHGVCCFPECENQNYCLEIYKEENGIFNRGELDYYMDMLDGFIKYIRPRETNGGVQEVIDGLEEFVKIYTDRVRGSDVR